MMTLSVITPYYREFDYIKKLSKVLEPQLNNRVEWIIVDDGCKEHRLDTFKAKVIHLEENSGGASIPRNIGLNNAKGKFITFIDCDDLVSKDYVRKILEKINMCSFDYCYISWQHIGKTNDLVIIKEEPPIWNTSVWNCIYKRELIGNNRFNPELCIGEDRKFNKAVRKGIRRNITDILYYYRDGVLESLMQKKVIYNEKYKKE